ncbi:MAG: glycosyltransferase [Phycisphaerae bacterium]|nr:glycosyltransferase [Phycisphaerae bacterium]
MTNPSPKPVLFVVNSLARGGMEQMVLALGRQLIRAGRYRPVVACLAEPGELVDEATADGIEVHAGLLHHKYDLFAVRRLRKLFRGDALRNDRQPVAAVVVVNPGGDRMFWTAIARGRRGRRPPLALWLQHTPRPGIRVLERLNRLLVGRYDAIAAQGPLNAAAWAQLEKLPPGRMHLVANGLPISQIDRLSPRWTRGEARAELGLAAGDVAVMCVANPRPIKRADLFCQAAAALRDSRPDLPLRFLLAGDGPSREQLIAEIDRLGLATPTFRWLGQRRDIDRLWPAADIGVCCSDSEGLSVTMLEAMAAGVAFISTAVGEHPTLIESGQSGLLTPAGDAPALAAAIAVLASDAPQRTRLAVAAQSRLRADFTAESMAAHFEQMLAAIVRPPS